MGWCVVKPELGWSGGAKVLCILHHWGVQLILAYSWARPAILVVGKGRGGMFLFLLFLHFHSCSSFFPVPLFHLLYSLFLSLFSLSLGDDTKWPSRVDMSLNPNTIKINLNSSSSSHTSWGADRITLLHLYRSLIQSKLDYGSIVYGSARKSYLQMFDTVHNQGLRLALGAFRTSPVSSLNVEADEPSLWLRREKLSFSMPSDLLVTLLTILLKSHFHHIFRNIMKENLTLLNPSAFV